MHNCQIWSLYTCRQEEHRKHPNWQNGCHLKSIGQSNLNFGKPILEAYVHKCVRYETSWWDVCLGRMSTQNNDNNAQFMINIYAIWTKNYTSFLEKIPFSSRKLPKIKNESCKNIQCRWTDTNSSLLEIFLKLDRHSNTVGSRASITVSRVCQCDDKIVQCPKIEVYLNFGQANLVKIVMHFNFSQVNFSVWY